MNTPNPLDGFQIDPSTLQTIGTDLQRPECILAERDGTLWAADARGGVMRIAADGTQRFISQQADARFTSAADSSTADFEAKFTQGTLPNGLAFARNGDLLISNFGTDRLERMTRSGEVTTLHDRIDGQPIGKVNFVLRDSKDRIWLTVSTRVNPWTTACLDRVVDGYIAVVDEHGLRVVAENFAFTNEIRLDANEEWLYIAETTGPRISRMRLVESAAGVRLVDREVYGPSELPGCPDGIALDAFGNLWCTLVLVDQLVAITPQGDLRMVLDDSHPEKAARYMQKFTQGTATMDDMMATHGSVAPWMASLTFGGPDLKTVYIGSLRGTTIPFFRSPVAGLPMVHWHERH